MVMETCRDDKKEFLFSNRRFGVQSSPIQKINRFLDLMIKEKSS